MNLVINETEKQQLLEALNIAVKSSQNSLAAASTLLPLAAKIDALKPEEKAAE